MNRLLKLIHIAERRWCKPARLRIKVILGVAAASAVSARAAVDSALPARPDAGIDLGPHLLPIVILGGFVTLGVGVVLWWQRRMFRQLAEQARRLRAQDEQLQGELATRLQTEAALRESQALVRRFESASATDLRRGSGAGKHAGQDAREPEAREPRGPGGRHRPRFQQSAHGDSRERFVCPRHNGRQRRPPRANRDGGAPRGRPLPPDARLRGQGAPPGGAHRPGSADSRHHAPDPGFGEQEGSAALEPRRPAAARGCGRLPASPALVEPSDQRGGSARRRQRRGQDHHATRPARPGRECLPCVRRPPPATACVSKWQIRATA
jgi:hypothetical protein